MVKCHIVESHRCDQLWQGQGEVQKIMKFVWHNLWQYKDRKFQYQNIWVSAGFVLTKKVEENHMWTLQFEIINRHCTAGAHCNELCVKIPAKTTSLVFYTFNMIADIFISVFIDIGIMLAKKHIVVSLFLKLSTVAKNPMPASWIRCLNH